MRYSTLLSVLVHPLQPCIFTKGTLGYGYETLGVGVVDTLLQALLLCTPRSIGIALFFFPAVVHRVLFLKASMVSALISFIPVTVLPVACPRSAHFVSSSFHHNLVKHTQHHNTFLRKQSPRVDSQWQLSTVVMTLYPLGSSCFPHRTHPSTCRLYGCLQRCPSSLLGF